MSIKALKAGNRSFSGLAGQVPEHHVLLQEYTVGAGGTTSITFSNIDQSYQHLQIRGIARPTSAINPPYNVFMSFNGDVSNNYYTHRLLGDGASAASYASASRANGFIFYTPGSSTTANIFGTVIIDILDYTSTSKYKSVRSLGGYDANGSGYINFFSMLWMSTNSISSLSITSESSSNWTQYTSFQLYGVK